MALRRVRDGYWVCNTRAEIENQFGTGLDFRTGDALTIVGGDASGGWIWDATSSATPGSGVIQVPGETGRFILSSATSGAGLVTSSGSGTASAFVASQRRIFHSDGVTAGGSWEALTEADISNAIGDGTIEADKIKPSSTNNQVLRTVSGVTVWSNETVTTLIPLVSDNEEGSVTDFPAGQVRIFHSDGATDGGSWAQLDATVINSAIGNGAISVGKISTTGGTTGQVIKIVSGTAQWADDDVDVSVPLVTSGAAGASNSFPSGQTRLFSSNGSTTGGQWAQLTSTEVGAAFASASIAPSKITTGTNGQVLTMVSGTPAWAAVPSATLVSSAVAGQVNSFPASQTRLFSSNGSTGGGSWAQLTSTEVGAAFASASIAPAKLTAGSNGQQLTTVSGVPTWTTPDIAITGAVNGDIIRRESGAWARYALLNTPNAPLLSISGLPTWSSLNTAPTFDLGSSTSVTGFPMSMATYGDNRAIFLDAGSNTIVNSIADTGFRHGPYVFINASDFNITLAPDSSTSFCGFISPTGEPIVLEPSFAVLAHYYGEGSIRDFFVMQVFDSDGLAELMAPGEQGDLFTHNGTKWVRLAAAATDKYKLMSGGPSANVSWKRDDDCATVVVSSGYSGTARNIFPTWETGFAAAVAHGGPARIYVEDTGSTLNISGATYDGLGRVGVYLCNRTSSSSTTISMAAGAEIRNITELVAFTTHPFDTFPVNIEVNGTSTNSAAIYMDSFRGMTFTYSGKFNWTGSRTYSIRVRNNHTVRMRELVHSGQGMHSNSDILLVVEHGVTPPAFTSDSGTATLNVRQLSGSPLVASSFSWPGSGGVTISKADNSKSLAFSPAKAINWPEGAPSDPSDALDKLAARTPGAMAPGNQLFHGNYWFSFGKDTESLNVNPAAESLTLWVPKYNHWLLLGMLTASTDTTHSNLNVGVTRNFRRMNQQGFFRFDASIGQQISSTFARPFTAYVIPNGSGVRIVVSANLTSSSSNHVATSDDGGQTWTLRTGPFGSSLTGMHSMCWTGTTLVGVRSASATTVGRSTNGTSWSTAAITSGTYLKVVSDGNGTVVAFRNGNTCMYSTDHGATWTSASIPSWSASFFDAIYFDGKFILLDNSGTAWTSPTGVTWTPSAVAVSNPGKTSYLPYGWSYRSLVKCGGVLACMFKGTYAAQTMSELFYSYDGLTWHDGGVADASYFASYETSSLRFATHLSSSTPNSAADAATNIHQMVCRMPGLAFDDFDTSSLFIASPAILANISGIT